MKKVSRRVLRRIVSVEVERISAGDRDEMAIPSYLHWNPLIRWLMWRRYAVISELAGFSVGMTVLEFGCGTGVFLPELTERFETIYAIDLFPEYAKRLCDELRLDVTFIDDLAAIADGTLDVIVAADVLEHLDADELGGYLDVFSRKLKGDGRLIVSGPTESFVYKLGRLAAGFAGKEDYHHTDIDALIEAIGGRFALRRVRRLPFGWLPVLFKVCEFGQRGRR